MFGKIARLALLAVLGMLSLIKVAGAQNMPTPPPTPPVKIRGSIHSNSSDRKPSTIGWVYVHPNNCVIYYSGTTIYLGVYPVEGGFLYTASSQIQTLLEPACQTGNYVAFYFYDTLGHWNEVYTYTFK